MEDTLKLLGPAAMLVPVIAVLWKRLLDKDAEIKALHKERYEDLRLMKGLTRKLEKLQESSSSPPPSS